MSDPADGPDRRRRKVYMLAKQLGLTREERLQLTEVLLWRDVPSWGSLSDAEVQRVLDAIEGYALISHALSERQP